MKQLTLVILLTLIAPFGWSETWVCVTETFIGDKRTARGSAGTDSDLMVYSVDGDVVRYYDNLLKMKVIHNDERALVAVSTNTNPKLRKPSFSYLLIDKVHSHHVFDHVETQDDASRDSGECKLAK
ncbi:MAG: hypothetical protein ACJ0RG_03260 [Candidatus Azotimanducaceae bacterium]